MKKVYLAAIIAVFGLIRPNHLLAQTKLNQIELIKQFISNWKVESGKDTTVLWEIKSYGTGLECNFRYVIKDAIFTEGRQIWEYDNKTDKFILTSATEGIEAGNSALWFTSKDKSIIVPLNEIADPQNASFRLEMEFKSPGMFLQSTIVNNKVLNTDTFHRINN